MLLAKSQRGDTIIEVILACAIFAMVTVSAFTIMQRASSNAYDAMERSQVRLVLNGQADLLYYLRDQYVQALAAGSDTSTGQASVWHDITTNATYSSTIPGINACLPETHTDYFYIHKGASFYELKSGADITDASGLPEPGKGIWIQRVDSVANSANKRYKDFYIMACWQNTTNGTQYMSSVVRMYDAQ